MWGPRNLVRESHPGYIEQKFRRVHSDGPYMARTRETLLTDRIHSKPNNSSVRQYTLLVSERNKPGNQT